MIRRLVSARGNVVLARRVVAIVGFVGASASVFAFTEDVDSVRAMLLLGVAGVFTVFMLTACSAGCIDIYGRGTGATFGLWARPVCRFPLGPAMSAESGALSRLRP